MLVAGVIALLLNSALPPDPAARAILDTAIARMGGLTTLGAVDRVRLEVMTEWQRTEFETRRPPVILSYELSTELRDYTVPAWRYSRRFYSPNGTSGVVDLVSDSVAAMEMNGRWRPQNVAYVDERDEVFTFAPERLLVLAHGAGSARAVGDTLIDGVRYARVVATVGKFQPTLHFRRSDGLLAFAQFRAAQPNDFGLAPWGAMDVRITYSRWQKIPNSSLVLPMQLDVARVGRPYKRMTTLSIAVNPSIPAESLVIADSLRSAFLAASRKPMFDLPMDSARIIDGSFAVFGTPGTPLGAVKLGGRWLFLEAGTAPLSIERSAAFLRRTTPDVAIGGALITAPTGAGGVAWLAREKIMAWVTSPALPFTKAVLRGWPVPTSGVREVTKDAWIRVGTDSMRVETIDLPDFPGTSLVYVPTLRWAYVFPAGPVQMDYVVAHVRQRGWHVDRIGSVRSFVGVAVTPTSALNR
jgi:hypothetical protein